MSDSLRPTSDGAVVIRPPRPEDKAVLIAGRDERSRRFVGDSPDPRPTACIEVAGEVVGWVDFDLERDWLEPGEVNVGYGVSPSHRGRGYAGRGLQLLMHHLAIAGQHHTATLLIHPENRESLAVAAYTRFEPHGEVNGSLYFKRPMPALSYSDDVVTIRRLREQDLDRDLAAKDDVQIDGLWLPGQRQAWQAMSSAEQRAHALRHLQACHDAFATGPKWAFAVDTPGAEYVAYVDCDLANDSNISYASHPGHRGKGHVTRAVRLALRFLREHTGARHAHLVIDEANAASLRVAAALGAERCDSRRHRLAI